MRTPVSTYRLQITARFDLFAAAGVLPYLHDLGVDWVYLSPLLEAEPGSDHGYDVVAHDRIDPARGGAEGLAAVSAEARRLGMGVLVDIVPNHVGIATPHVNAGWWDLLTHGSSSRYAAAFDVDWAFGGGRVRIPVVGDDDVLPEGRIGHLELVGRSRDHGDELRYFDHRFPIAPGTADGTPDEIHARQHYELVSWRVADHGLNYRRFFAVNSLAGIRVEDRAVFDESHVEIRRWFDEGLVDGLRVDHPDGLRDPASYLDDLAGLTGGAYVLVEKILEPGERLEPGWATAGTTGYDVLGLVDRVLTDPNGQQPLTALEARLHGRPFDWSGLIHDTKRAVADGILGSEVRRVVRESTPQVEEVAQQPSRDQGTDDLVDAVAELVACFPVYRSYLPEGREHLDHALADARRRRPDLAAAFDALAPVLGDERHPAAQRFQQTTCAVLAVAGVAALLVALAYPVIATNQWTLVHGPRDWQGLNSVAFMEQISADDVAAMAWLYDNAEEGDIIIEMPGCSYQDNGGIPTSGLAAMTGVPDIIGWNGHEFQWRGGQPELLNQIGQREADVAAIYSDPQSDLVGKYDATLLYVGSFERYGTPSCQIPVPGSLTGETYTGPYASIGNPDFPGAGWEQVFSSGETAIYRRVETAG
jgi:maltooligosyltrehalose synthase